MAFMAFIKPNKINFFLEGESPTLMKKRKKKKMKRLITGEETKEQSQ